MSISPELYDSIVHIVDQRIGEIKVAREDFNKLASGLFELTTAVKELAEAQKRTDGRLERTEARLDKLTETVTELASARAPKILAGEIAEGLVAGLIREGVERIAIRF